MFAVDRNDVFCFCLKVFDDRLLSRWAGDKQFHAARPQKAKLRLTSALVTAGWV